MPEFKRKILLYTLIAIPLLVIGLFYSLLPTENLRLVHDPVNSLNEDWRIVQRNKAIEKATLPFRIPVESQENYTIERLLTDDFPSNTNLLLRSSMQSMKVLIDGESIFATATLPDGPFISPEASVWYFVKLPDDVKGKKLTIIISSKNQDFAGRINPIYYGSGEALVYFIIGREWTTLLIALLLFILGIVIMLLFIFFAKIGGDRLLYLGLFIFLMSLWLFSEAKILQLLTGNRFLLGGTSLLAIALMPVPFVLYIREVVLTRYGKLLKGMAVVFYFNFLLDIGLQVKGIASLFQSATLTILMILIMFFGIFGLMIREVLRYNSLQAKKHLLYFSVLFMLAAFEMVQFLLGNYAAVSKYSPFGFVVFICFLAENSISIINQLMLKEQEAQFFEKLAYKDILTGGNNRAAFEKAIDELIQKSEPFRLVLFDMNDFKSINDRFGHQEGDKAIITCFQGIATAFPTGNCYRLGGDEFACILRNTETDDYEQGIRQLKINLSLRDNLPYLLEVAIGSEIYDPRQGYDLKAFFHRVDSLMYINKNEMKLEPKA